MQTEISNVGDVDAAIRGLLGELQAENPHSSAMHNARPEKWVYAANHLLRGGSCLSLEKSVPPEYRMARDTAAGIRDLVLERLDCAKEYFRRRLERSLIKGEDMDAELDEQIEVNMKSDEWRSENVNYRGKRDLATSQQVKLNMLARLSGQPDRVIEVRRKVTPEEVNELIEGALDDVPEAEVVEDG